MDTMNKEQLEALTPKERWGLKWAQRQGTGGWVDILTALADARLEVARLREELERARDLLHQCRGNLTLGALRPTLPLWEAIDAYLREEKYDA